MKKKIIVLLSFIFVIVICVSVYFVIDNNNQKRKEQEKNNELKRYAEIKESAKKASEQFLRATHPNCTISNEFSETYTTSGYENASWLINNGLIKKSELLDVDKKSYCDVHLKYWSYFENPLDHQRNCEVYYQIYLKCKNYEDKEYVEY